MTARDVHNMLWRFLVEELAVPAELLDGHTPLLDGGLIDSLGVVTLVAFCEDELGCTVPAEEIAPEAFASLASLEEAVGRWRRPTA